jgi:predicted permease
MTILRRLRSLWRNLVHRQVIDADLDDELRAYVELASDERRKAGLPGAAARRGTLVDLGGFEQAKERVREVRTGASLERIAQDVGYGLRMLRKHPAFTAVAVITLALGVGANTAVWSVVETAVLRPLPYRQPDRLLKICSAAPMAKPCQDDFSAAELDVIRAAHGIFTDVAADDGTMATVVRADGSREQIGIGLVTANWLSTLGVRPMLGRDFAADDQLRGRDTVVILTHEYWKRRFKADRQAIGATITFDGQPHTIIGVLPANVVRTYADLLKPLVLDGYKDSSLDLFGRLEPGVTPSQARAGLAIVGQRLARAFPSTNAGRGLDVIPLGKYYAPIEAKAVGGLLLMLGAVALVLLIACANVANLLLARAGARRRESVVRAALGASRGRLVRQFLLENLLLFFVGGAAGIVVARLSLESLEALAAAGQYLPERMELAIDARVLAFSFVAMLVTGFVFGLAPALQASNIDLASSLRDSARTVAPGRATVRRLLIVAQLALSLVLLAGFGLLVRSFARIYAASGGFSSAHVLVTGADGGRSFPEAVTFWNAVLEATRAIPGVASAAVTSRPPVHLARSRPIAVEGQPPPSSADAIRAGDIMVSAEYFDALGIHVVRGRVFSSADTQTSRPVVVISESVARRAFPNENPIGRRISVVERAPLTCCSAAGPVEGVWREIVGVVGDVRQANLDEQPALTIYRPFTQIVEHDMYVVLRVDPRQPERRVAGELRKRLASAGSGLSHRDWLDVRTMAEVIHDSGSIRLRRFVLILLGIFAAIALALAAVGVYGVTASAVAERTREIGVRMALGATGLAIFRDVAGELLALAASGVVLGLAGMLPVSRAIRSMLFGIGTADAPTYIGVAAVLGAVVILAAYVPSRRAMRIDPIAALRSE